LPARKTVLSRKKKKKSSGQEKRGQKKKSRFLEDHGGGGKKVSKALNTNRNPGKIPPQESTGGGDLVKNAQLLPVKVKRKKRKKNKTHRTPAVDHQER